MSIEIREAQESDATAIVTIYNHYIVESTATFDTTPLGKDHFLRKIKSIKKNFPFLVVTEHDKVIGYAYATSWNIRAAYKHTAETTIYIDPIQKGNGIGLRLYNALLSSLPLYDIVTAIGGITIPNEASEKLHEKLGFEKVAHFKNVGFKFDQWLDVGYWQKNVI
ncbi:GNAT family N-acetyltransferase [Bacteroidia bacterium]|nr:GNAT family N-acetyltransferase [Bacteroidia bacterium]MDB9881905.1 GNAT family N-acetyltransferase [Bacteroidia bacterium]MDC1394904.1 GNAT family N-acetyltransferase [Bacteroidia bacterium]